MAVDLKRFFFGQFVKLCSPFVKIQFGKTVWRMTPSLKAEDWTWECGAVSCDVSLPKIWVQSTLSFTSDGSKKTGSFGDALDMFFIARLRQKDWTMLDRTGLCCRVVHRQIARVVWNDLRMIQRIDKISQNDPPKLGITSGARGQGSPEIPYWFIYNYWRPP